MLKKINLEIRPHRSGDESEIVELWKEVFNKKRSVEHWQWRFNKCPFGKGIVMLALDGDKIISFYSTNRMDIKVKQEIVKAVHGFDGATHPDYRKQGIFTLILKKLTKDYTEEGVKFMYGYPNTNSYQIHLKYFSWTGHGLIELWVKDLKKKDNGAGVRNNGKIQQVNVFDDRVNQLWNRAKNNLKVGIVRNKDYLNWRYVENPSIKYHKVYYLDANDVLSGFVVLKIHIQDDTVIGHIIDILASNEIAFNELIQYSYKFFNEKDVSLLSCWFPKNHSFSKFLTNEGFALDIMDHTCFGVKSISNIAKIKEYVEKKDNWYMTMGDCDIF